MTTQALRLRSVQELLGYRFLVPAYQRGYRWEERQVVELLDDLKAFLKGNPPRESYYCLQPIVVRRRDGEVWELIDGQQRLTTIFLVLRALIELRIVLGVGCFDVEYETRTGSAEFLKDPTEARAKEHIDYHFMYAAFRAIQRWFERESGGLKLDIVRCLTGEDGGAPNVRVIWYELDTDQDPVRAFTRLNVGRIPLTSAELIRALFLRSDKKQLDPRDAQQIPRDWDEIEHRLQDDSYWYFLQSDTTPASSRIEFLFDVFVMTASASNTDENARDPLATFLAFQKILENSGKPPSEVWLDFKRLALTLESWFEDRALFHLVGFLVATHRRGAGRASPRRADAALLADLLKSRQGRTASDFDRSLRERAWAPVMGSRAGDALSADSTREALAERVEARVAELNSGSSSTTAALLLFNVATLLEQEAESQRFRFDGYKTNRWDIEHVRSVAEAVPESARGRREWLEHARKFVSSPTASGRDPEEVAELVAEIDPLLASIAPDPAKFNDVFARVRALSGEAEAREDDDSLSNLVLLDMGTNRSYQNAIFPVKRARVIDLDKRGQFVPPATRNVFLKYYSPDAAQLMLWDEADQGAYAVALATTLTGFFEPLLSQGGSP